MSYEFPRCQILPLPDHQVSVQIDGTERLRWHYGPQYPRPFFYPLIGPSGTSLTRMGHPGAENHDHHRSVWFAHNKVLGIDFWSDRTEATIRQQHWYAYMDGDEEALLAVKLGWYDGHDPKPLLDQDVIAAVRPTGERETELEIQTTFQPRAEALEFQQTNFGFFAVRVAKNISEYFGGGKLTSSEGRVGEKAIFGRAAKWMDYSGPVPGDKTEGVTYFDHPTNPNYPSRWHVREDGWMGASFCRDGAYTTTRERPLLLRYLLHVHAGEVEPKRAEALANQFAARPPLEVSKTDLPHRQYIARRAANS